MNPIDIVGELVKAEETQAVETMEKHLDPGFAITRGNGHDSGYTKYLEEVRAGQARGRKLVDPVESPYGDCSVVRSVVTVGKGGAGERFRNIHVFVKLGGACKCVAWQATPIQE